MKDVSPSKNGVYHISSVIRHSILLLKQSKKTDLDLCDCFGRVKLILYQNYIGLI